MAAVLSTLAASADPWQPVWLPFLKLAVGCCLVSFGAPSEFTHEPERQRCEADAKQFLPQWKVRSDTFKFKRWK